MTATRYSRDDIIAAAGRLFAAQGYHGTSMRDLGRALGLRGSSLYSHVASKEDLLVAVVERGAALFQASADAATSSDLSPTDQLWRLIRGHIDVVLDHRDEARTFLNEAKALDDTERTHVIAHRDLYEQAFRDTIHAGVEAGRFRPGTDPALTSIFALSILNSVDRWYDASGPLDRKALADAIYAAMVQGIEA
jgi:AcrR family transcriptional regulator